MNLETIKVKLHNLNIWLGQFLRYREPNCCGYFKNPDGRLVECSEWIGYQDCMFPGCNHYYIEHSDGSPSEVLYVKPELTYHRFEEDPTTHEFKCSGCSVEARADNGTEQCPGLVQKGDKITDPEGCMNAGCDQCPGFWDKNKLHAYVQQLGVARNHASHWFNLDECPGVVGSDAKVNTSVDVRIVVRYPSTPEEYAILMDKQRGLQAKFPDVNFAFYLDYERQPSNDVKSVED